MRRALTAQELRKVKFKSDAFLMDMGGQRRKRAETAAPGTCTNRFCKNWLLRKGKAKLAKAADPCPLCVALAKAQTQRA